MTLPLDNKVALVTGSGRGIGAAIAICLAKNGANVVINDLSEENSKKIVKEIEGLGRKAIVSGHDVSIADQAKDCVNETLDCLGSLDVLINNAGILRDAMLLKLEENDWDDVIRVNLKGPFNMAKEAASQFKKQNSGKIVNISSIAWRGNVGQTNYSAAKAGVVGLTRTWAVELARYNVTVNAIAPGLVGTEMTQQIPDEIKAKLVKAVPLNRMAEPNEIAECVNFLVGPHSQYITGQVIHVDGGMTTGLKLG